MSTTLNSKIPVFAIGYFGIVLSSSIRTSLFEFYPIPLNTRQKDMIKEDLLSKTLDFEELDSVIQATVKNAKVAPATIFMAVDTLFNNFEKIFSVLVKHKNKIKSVFCVHVSDNNIKEEIKRILKTKPQDIDTMIVVFTGNEKDGVCKAKDFFETTDFILSSTGFINMSLRDILTLGDIVFFSKYTAPRIKEVQKQVIDDFSRHNNIVKFKHVKKIVINFKAPMSITVADVNDALYAIINHLSKDVDVQWGLFVSDKGSIEINVYFGLDKETFLK